MFVKPNPDKKVNGEALKVFDPTRREFLPAEGRDVTKSAYWMRRIQKGDVIRMEESKPAPKKEPEKKASKSGGSKKGNAKNKSKAPAKQPGQAKQVEPAKQADATQENKGE